MWMVPLEQSLSLALLVLYSAYLVISSLTEMLKHGAIFVTSKKSFKSWLSKVAELTSGSMNLYEEPTALKTHRGHGANGFQNSKH